MYLGLRCSRHQGCTIPAAAAAKGARDPAEHPKNSTVVAAASAALCGVASIAGGSCGAAVSGGGRSGAESHGWLIRRGWRPGEARHEADAELFVQAQPLHQIGPSQAALAGLQPICCKVEVMTGVQCMYGMYMNACQLACGSDPQLFTLQCREKRAPGVPHIP